MRGTRYTQEVKEEVERLRRQGKTYSEIRAIYDIPKSTLSNWLGEKYSGIFDTQAQIKHLQRIRKLSASALHERKRMRDEIHAGRGRDGARSLPYHDIAFQRSLLAMLYWAEGKKKGGALVFANTDPRLALFYITLLRNCYPIDESKLRVRVHLHQYHDKQASLQYWSELLKIPLGQFGKLYVKKRSASRKFRQNFRGICFVVYSNTGLLHELLALGEAVGDQVTTRYSSRPESN